MSVREKKLGGYDVLSETITLANTDSSASSAFQMKPFRANDSEYVTLYAKLSAGAAGNVVVTIQVSDTSDGTFVDSGATLFTIAGAGTVGSAKFDLRQYPAPWYKINCASAGDDSTTTADLSIFRI